MYNIFMNTLWVLVAIGCAIAIFKKVVFIAHQVDNSEKAGEDILGKLKADSRIERQRMFEKMKKTESDNK